MYLNTLVSLIVFQMNSTMSKSIQNSPRQNLYLGLAQPTIHLSIG